MCGDVECSQFGFSGRGHDEAYDLADLVEWSIVVWDGVVFGEEDICSGVTAGARFREEPCIRVRGKHH